MEAPPNLSSGNPCLAVQAAQCPHCGHCQLELGLPLPERTQITRPLGFPGVLPGMERGDRLQAEMGVH